MIRTKRTALMASLAVLLVFGTLQWAVFASHSWGGYHWARTSNPFTLSIGDNVTSSWDENLHQAAVDWSATPPNNIPRVLNVAVVPGQAPNPRNCRPKAGRVEVCNAAYGNNGWLGVASVWISGTHITQGTVKLNDTYFNTAQYNTYAWRQLVTCQEIGHTFGLDHQDEEFNNTNLNTCMDYTSNPASNQKPNEHDFEELALIYEHLDTSTTLKSSPGSSNADLDNPSHWGQLMKSTRSGRTQVFDRDLGNGEHVVTFVIWA